MTIDIDALVRIADLFRFRWDPPILAVLAERPFRFRALHTRLETHVGEHVDDNALTRSLHRLTRSGLVRAETKPAGNRSINTYSLSTKGREHVRTYEAIVESYIEMHLPQGDRDGGLPVPSGQSADRVA